MSKKTASVVAFIIFCGGMASGQDIDDFRKKITPSHVIWSEWERLKNDSRDMAPKPPENVAIANPIPMFMPMEPIQDEPDVIIPVDLMEEIHKSGFGNHQYPVHSFVDYGNVRLRNMLNDRDAKQKAIAEIMKIQEDIAQKIFFCNYTYSVSDIKNHGDGNASFVMACNTKFICKEIDEVDEKIVFPIPDVTGTAYDYYLPPVVGPSIFRLSVSGSAASINELMHNRNSYQVRLTFKDLLPNSGPPTAKVISAEIVKAK